MDIEKNIDVIIENFKELKTSSSKIYDCAKVCIETIENGNKIILCGNGGSASDAQHLAAELVVKYKCERRALPAISLSTDTSIITAVGNDIGSEMIFARQVEAIGKAGDVLISITTSGNSKNIINAINYAKNRNIKTIVLTGESGGEAGKISDYTIYAPSDITNNIQEMHIAIGHILCGIIEEHFNNVL